MYRHRWHCNLCGNEIAFCIHDYSLHFRTTPLVSLYCFVWQKYPSLLPVGHTE